MRVEVNRQLSTSSRLARVLERREPFTKTATHKIKRYLYSADNMHHVATGRSGRPGSINTWGKRMRSLELTGLVLLAASGTALASGYRIPEQSVNSTARAGGYVAHTPGADATYFNPANMAWLDPKAQVEANATWIHLTSIEYTDSRTSLYHGDSEKENFLVPTLFAVSPDYNGLRAGFSFTAPGGLSKRWQDPSRGPLPRNSPSRSSSSTRPCPTKSRKVAIGAGAAPCSSTAR